MPHPSLPRFLSRKYASTKAPWNLFPIVEAMVRSRHPDAAAALVETITRKATSRRFDPDYQRRLYLLQDLPPSATSEAGQLVDHPKCNDEAREQIPWFLSKPFDDYFTL